MFPLNVAAGDLRGAGYHALKTSKISGVKKGKKKKKKENQKTNHQTGNVKTLKTLYDLED